MALNLVAPACKMFIDFWPSFTHNQQMQFSDIIVFIKLADVWPKLDRNYGAGSLES